MIIIVTIVIRYHRRTRATTWTMPTCLMAPASNDIVISQLDSVKSSKSVLASKVSDDISQQHADYEENEDEIEIRDMISGVSSTSGTNKIKNLEKMEALCCHMDQIDQLLAYSHNLISALVANIVQEKSSQVQTLCAKILWLISLSPTSVKHFLSHQSWVSMGPIILKNSCAECGLYYAATCSFLSIGESMNIISTALIENIRDWLRNNRHGENFDCLFSAKSNRNIPRLVDDKILLCLSEMSSRGSSLPGYVLTSLFKYMLTYVCSPCLSMLFTATLINSTTQKVKASDLIQRGVLSAIQRLLAGSFTPEVYSLYRNYIAGLFSFRE